MATTRIATDSDDQLVWTLDEATPPFANSGVWGAADLTAVNTPTYNQQGIFATSKAVQFPGTTNYRLRSPDSVAQINFPITLSCWVKLTAYTTWGCFVTKALSSSSWTSPYYTMHLALQNTNDGQWQADIVVGSAVGVGIVLGASDTADRLSLGVWHHVGLTYNGTSFIAYMDGRVVGCVSETRALYYSGGNGCWGVGDVPPSGTNALNGLVDDIRFASVARPASWFGDVYNGFYELDGSFHPGDPATVGTLISDFQANYAIALPEIAGSQNADAVPTGVGAGVNSIWGGQDVERTLIIPMGGD